MQVHSWCIKDRKIREGERICSTPIATLLLFAQGGDGVGSEVNLASSGGATFVASKKERGMRWWIRRHMTRGRRTLKGVLPNLYQRPSSMQYSCQDVCDS